MVDFMKWFLGFVKDMVRLLFTLVVPDGFSFGYMVLGAAIIGVVVSGTIGMVAIVSNALSRRGGRD